MTFNSDKTLVITGAGISVESGIQPFRGENGIWEKNPMEMATKSHFQSNPASFLSWYHKRYLLCKDAQPNDAHLLLATSGFRVITQNVDALHLKAGHPDLLLIQIHGNIFFKRRVDCNSLKGLVPADWDRIREEFVIPDLLDLFSIRSEKVTNTSYRPHILLFDEFYSDLYEFEVALEWLNQAETLVLMGTSNAVGITEMAVSIALQQSKKIVVVDPNPAPSLLEIGAEVFRMKATEFCKMVFNQA